jgi:transposase
MGSKLIMQSVIYAQSRHDIPAKLSQVCGRVGELIEHASNELLDAFRMLIERLLDHLKEFDRQVDEHSDGTSQQRRQVASSRRSRALDR